MQFPENPENKKQFPDSLILNADLEFVICGLFFQELKYLLIGKNLAVKRTNCKEFKPDHRLQEASTSDLFLPI